MTRSGSVLASYGVDVQDAVAMITAANESMQNPEVVARGMKNIAINLAGIKTSAKDGSLELNKTAKGLSEIAGIDVFTDGSKTKMKDMVDILNEVSIKWEDLNDKQKAGLSEAIAGKEQAATFQALIGNWEKVLEFQDAYNNGWTVGSAAAENERFIDSIAGKINILKENFVDMITTLVSTDAFKSMLDGAIVFVEALSKVIRGLDEVGLLLPTLAIVGNQAFGFLKTMATGEKSNGLFADTVEGISSMVDFMKILSSDTAKADGVFKTLVQSVLGLGKSSKGIEDVVDAVEDVGDIAEDVGDGMELISATAEVAAKSSGSLLKTILKFGAAGVVIGGVVVGISHLIKKTNEANTEYERLNQEAQKNVDKLSGEINANNDKINSLKSISDEYDNLNKKVNKTAEEESRLKELTKEIANIMPELVSGYDSEGNPILRMTGDTKDLISQLERANQLKERMLASEKKDVAMGAMGMMNTDANNNLEQIAKREQDFNKEIASLELERKEVMNKLSKATSMEDRKKVLNDLENINGRIESTENDFNMFLSDQATEISSYNAQVSDALLSTVQSKDEFVGASEETKNAMLELIPALDFSEIRPDELNQVTRAMDELVKLSNDGTIDLGNIKDSVFNLNNELANGQISVSEYNKYMGDLANYLSDLTGVDASVFTRMFDEIAFGSTNAKEGLSELDKEISNTLTQLATTKDLDIRFDGLVELGNREDIPQQLSDIIDAVTQDGMVTDKDMDLVFKALFEPESEEVQNAINEFNNTEVSINTSIMGEEQIESFKQKLEGIKSIDPKVKLELIKAYQEGDITFLEEHLRGLPEEEKVKIIADVKEAIGNLSEFEQKKIEDKTAKVKTEVEEPESKGGILDFIFGKSKQKDTVVNATVNTQVNGLDQLKETERILNGIGGGKVGQSGYGIQRSLNESHDISLMNDVESINDKIRAKSGGSSSGGGGGYQVVVNVVVNGIDQIESLKNNLSTIKTAEIIVSTAQAAKNLSGLITRVQQYKTAADGAKTATFNTETAQGAKNITGLIKKVGEWNRTNAKTLTFKTNATTIANQVQNLINKVKAVPNGKTINYSIKTTGSLPKVPQTFSAYQRSIDSTANKIALLSDSTIAEPTVVASVQNDVMPIGDTPSTFKANPSYNDSINSVKYNIDMFIELENQIKKINSQLDILDKKAENAIGKDKIKYLEQQVELYKKQQSIQQKLISDMQKQQANLKSFLSKNGFTFDTDGMVKGYQDKLVSMEKQLEKLESHYENVQKIERDYKGDNQKEKDRLAANVEKARNELDKYKDSYDQIKDVLNEYLDLTFNGIPDAQDKWEDLNNSILDGKDAIKEFNKELAELKIDSGYKDINRDIDVLKNQLDMIDSKLEWANGNEKLDLLEQRIELTKQLSKETKDLLDYENSLRSGLMKDLNKYGFKFRDDGSIENYGAIIENLKKELSADEFEEVYENIEKYLEKTYDTIPDLEKELVDLENTWKNYHKEMLETTKEVEDKITSIYKQQVEDRKKLIDKELDDRLKALKKQQDAYNKYRDEVNYKNEYEDQLSTVEELQKKLDIAMKDNSLSGQKKVQELLKQLEEEQKKLQQIVQDKIDSDINDMFDSESDRLQQDAENAKDALDDLYSDEKLQEIVKNVLSTGIFEDIDGNLLDLQDVMMDFIDKYDDGMSAIGDIIKNEWISNLNIAKDTMKDMGDILKELNLGTAVSSMSRINVPDVSSFMNSVTKNVSNHVNFNQPLIVVEGGVDSSVVGDLEEFGDKLKNDVINIIMNGVR